ncbi:unnamed protein product, partial [Symbiodinium sp. KB8]
KLKFLDTEELLAKFKKSGGQIVFFSYEWQSWTKLGPNDVQLEWMRLSLSMYSQEHNVPLENLNVWLDILAIPQCHAGMKTLAVNSLYVYAASTSAFIIVAPECMHENTGNHSGIDSYKDRVWTRVEQVAMVSANGTKKMFVSKGKDGL